MEYLIDTHVCLWAIADRAKLSESVKTIFEDANNKIAIKLKVGKLTEFSTTMSEFIEKVYLTGFEILPCKNEHAIAYSIFDFSIEHRDPFDRYLTAMACFKKMSFITKDAKFQLYTDRLEIVW